MMREDLARLAASRAHRAHANARAAMADFESALQYLDEAIDALGDRKVHQLMPVAYDSLGRPVYPVPVAKPSELAREELPDTAEQRDSDVVSHTEQT
jgi:hypothetical protein